LAGKVVVARNGRKMSPYKKALLAEEKAFDRQRKKLLKDYEGQFVAIYKGKIVDHGPKDGELFVRTFKKLGEVPFLIARVEKTPTIYECPYVDYLC
jgi:Family of unknown function (DUF5678)